MPWDRKNLLKLTANLRERGRGKPRPQRDAFVSIWKERTRPNRKRSKWTRLPLFFGILAQPRRRTGGKAPGYPNGLPEKPRPYTDIKSYHAHFYFDEDSYEKAALVRKWSAERFPVELGNWNMEPRGPHVTPSFYFGFTNDLLPIIVPWLQLNSLGLTILLHPNTDDPRADHLYYTLWVNRSQPVNAYGMKRPGQPGGPAIEKILPNIKPTVKLEV